MAEVLSVGMAVADFVFRVRGIPSRAEKYRARALETVVGGPAANAAIAVARLGGRAVLVTRLGEDAIADTVRADLEAEGIACRIHRRGRSPVSAAMIDAAGERQVVNFPGDAPVGEVLRPRIGDEVFERLVDPLLGGINAGSADEMSIEACAPLLYEAARPGGPLGPALPGGNLLQSRAGVPERAWRSDPHGLSLIHL